MKKVQEATATLLEEKVEQALPAIEYHGPSYSDSSPYIDLNLNPYSLNDIDITQILKKGFSSTLLEFAKSKGSFAAILLSMAGLMGAGMKYYSNFKSKDSASLIAPTIGEVKITYGQSLYSMFGVNTYTTRYVCYKAPEVYKPPSFSMGE